MNIKLDWISFSVFHRHSYGADEIECSSSAYQTLIDWLGQDNVDLIMGEVDFAWEIGRKPYSHTLRSPSGVCIYLNPKLPHFLVEFSGRGCERFESDERAFGFLQLVRERVTRIDLACDLACETNPMDFAQSRNKGRFKSGGYQTSESGETIYVGSKTSDRYVRVYRYNDPHPRSHLLRVEYVFRDDQAKSALQYIMDNGYEAAARQCGGIYGWTHPAWNIDAPTEIEMKAERVNREQHKTVYWLYDTIAPLLVRLHNSGVLDFRKFAMEKVLPNLNYQYQSPDNSSDE